MEDTLLTMLNKPDARFSRKYPWAADLENMVMPSARRSFAKTSPGEKTMFKNLCTFCMDVIAVYVKSESSVKNLNREL
ncbi:MAG: hypothetical protein KAI84_06500 [Gammaproteobacteria bacterium]|jgi:hypothetical protein|nr:hypothetical protein [Gammaproteobacteria bacterium]